MSGIDDQRSLTTEEAAELLNVSKHTLRSWRTQTRKQRRQIGPVFANYGASVRYPMARLREYQRAGETGAIHERKT